MGRRHRHVRHGHADLAARQRQRHRPQVPSRIVEQGEDRGVEPGNHRNPEPAGTVGHHLVRLAMLFCGRCDMDEQFSLGIELMIRGPDGQGGEPAC